MSHILSLSLSQVWVTSLRLFRSVSGDQHISETDNGSSKVYMQTLQEHSQYHMQIETVGLVIPTVCPSVLKRKRLIGTAEYKTTYIHGYLC